MTHPTPTTPGWLEISINAPPVVHEALNSFLFDLGCQGLMLAELPELHLKGYLHAPFDTLSLQNQLNLFIENLQNIFPEARSVQWTLAEIETEDWAGNWKQFFKPDKITPKLMVVPVWEPIPPDRPEWIFKMDPGLTFGTSQHANLNPGTILELAPFFAPRLDPDDRLMLSGLLEDQASEVEAVMKPHGLVPERTLYQEEVVCLVFKRSGALV